jgi:hypothetical protein
VYVHFIGAKLWNPPCPKACFKSFLMDSVGSANNCLFDLKVDKPNFLPRPPDVRDSLDFKKF